LTAAGTDNTSTGVTASGTITINAVDGRRNAPIVRPIALSSRLQAAIMDWQATAADDDSLPDRISVVKRLPILTNASVNYTLAQRTSLVDLVDIDGTHRRVH
jgi:hypothetical protein